MSRITEINELFHHLSTIELMTIHVNSTQRNSFSRETEYYATPSGILGGERWMYSALSTLNTTTEVPLSKAPNPHLLPCTAA